MLLISWASFSFLFFYGWPNSVTACSEHAVRQAIFNGYVRELRPVKNQSTVTHLYVQTMIYNILSVNGQDEMIELLIWSGMTWTDEFLQWNPSDYEGCERITTLANTIWIPDYVYMNTLEIIDIGTNEFWYAYIYSNGTVLAYRSLHALIACKMEIKAFPFDTQTCVLSSASSTYTPRDVMIHKDENRPDGIVYGNNSEFKTISFSCADKFHYISINESYSELKCSLVLKRRPEYYIFVLLIPSFLLTMLCIIGIFTPNSSESERNEKMTLGLTTLLSMAVILNITADAMPKSDEGLPLLGYYILYEIGVCSLSTIFSTILICVHERANRRNWKPPTIIRWIASIPSSSDCLRSIKNSDKVINASKDKDSTSALKVHPSQKGQSIILTPENPTKKSIGDGNEILISLREIVAKVDQYLKNCEEDEQRRVVWASAINHIDFFLLVIFSIANCVLTLFTLF